MLKVIANPLKLQDLRKYLYEENHGEWKLFFDVELETSGGPKVLKRKLNTKDKEIST